MLENSLVGEILRAEWFPYAAIGVAALLLVLVVCLILSVSRENNLRTMKNLRGASDASITATEWKPLPEQTGDKTVEMKEAEALRISRTLADGRVVQCCLTREALSTIPGGRALIGRADDAHIRLMDLSVSRQHVYISWQAGGFMLQDAGSTAGIVVNGKRVSPEVKVPVNEGDEIRIGGVTLKFELLI